MYGLEAGPVRSTDLPWPAWQQGLAANSLSDGLRGLIQPGAPYLPRIVVGSHNAISGQNQSIAITASIRNT